MRRTRTWVRLDTFNFVFLILALAMLVFIMTPLLKTWFSSSPGTIWNTLLDEDVYLSILMTACCGLMATIVGLMLGLPLAYLLARHDFWGKRVLESLIDVPIVIPHSAVGIALLFVFGKQQIFGRFFYEIGIRFVDTLAGVVIAMMFVSVPFLIDSTRDGFKAVDPRLEKVARTLGASTWRTFWRVSLPLAWRSVVSGSIMMWARAISEFGAVLILAYHVPFFGEHPAVAPVLIFERFNNFGLDAARPIAVLVIVISLIAFVLLRTLATREEKP
ncbi:MAG: ABC transporter permease [Thermoleophilia bacterium]|nr:ABC transporter permease [Thermoleophilia bacterium]